MGDLLYVVELGANLLGNLLQGVRVSNKVKESSSHGSGSGIGSSNDTIDKTNQLLLTVRRERHHLQQVGFSPEFRGAEALASFGIAGLEEVVEEVSTIGLFAQLSALRQLTFTIGHISSSTGSESGEENLVKLKSVDDGHGSTLSIVSFVLY